MHGRGQQGAWVAVLAHGVKVKLGKLKPIKVPHVMFGSMPVAAVAVPEIKFEEPVVPPVQIKIAKVVLPGYRKLPVAKGNFTARKVDVGSVEVKPTTIEELALTVVDRVIDLAGLPVTTFRWGN